MLLGEQPDFFFDAYDGSPAILRELLKNSERLEKAELRRNDGFRCLSAIQIAQESSHSLETDGIRITTIKTFPLLKLRHKPDPDQATLHAICLNAQFGFDGRKFGSGMHDAGESLLGISNLQQFGEAMLLLFEQRAKAIGNR